MPSVCIRKANHTTRISISPTNCYDSFIAAIVHSKRLIRRPFLSYCDQADDASCVCRTLNLAGVQAITNIAALCDAITDDAARHRAGDRSAVLAELQFASVKDSDNTTRIHGVAAVRNRNFCIIYAVLDLASSFSTVYNAACRFLSYFNYTAYGAVPNNALPLQIEDQTRCYSAFIDTDTENNVLQRTILDISKQ